MKKLVIGMVAITLMCFLIPIFLTKKFAKIQVAQTKVEEKQEEKEAEYTYPQYATIKLLHNKDGSVEELPIDEYLYGVVAAEMPANYEKEALKAQAVVARTYTIYQIALQTTKKHEGADICDNSACCQAWIEKEDRLARWEEEKREENWNKIVSCVKETKGEVIEYEGKLINAFFHSNSGGNTETPVNVWGGNGYPYLQTVTTAGEDAYDEYQSEASYSYDQVRELVRAVHSEFEIDFQKKDCIQVLERTEGNRVKKIQIGNLTLSGVEIRNIFKLKSANFEVSLNEDQVKFQVIGYGHGVGMSQTGADSLAKQGKTYKEIIHHFYTKVDIKQL